MKNTVFIVAVAAMLGSCNQSNKQPYSEKELPADSVSTAPEKMADFILQTVNDWSCVETFRN